jgi:hypothetical protein
MTMLEVAFPESSPGAKSVLLEELNDRTTPSELEVQ